MLVPPDDPVKLVRLTRAQRRRPAAAAVGDVLRRVGARAPSGTTPPLQVVCERDAEAGAVLARNAWAGDFAGQLAFAGVRPPAALRPPPTAPSSWAATARRPPGRPRPAPACPAAPGRRSTRAPRS